MKDSRPVVVAEPSDGPPRHTPDWIASIPDPVPVPEPKSKRGNPESYTVRGVTYYVAATSEGYDKTGNASWYGSKFHGRTTSSGEPYDMYKLTAAHRTLPIPTYARVTRLDTGKSIVVRVNDRGPFHPDRLVDLSYAAAVKLDMVESGTAPVRVEVIDGRESRQYALQIGAYSTLQAADRVVIDLATRLDDVVVSVVKTGADNLFRVHIANVVGETLRARVEATLLAAGYGKPLVVKNGALAGSSR